LGCAFVRAIPALRYHVAVATFYVENFGCRANQADGAALECQLEQHGLARASTAMQADLVLFNSCDVTAAANQDARAAIRRVRRQNPDAKIIVTGCYAQRASEEIAALPGVSVVIGNSHKHQLADLALANVTFPEWSQPWLPALTAEAASSGCGSTFVPVATLTENEAGRTEHRIFVSDIFAHTELLAAPVFEGTGAANERTRPNLKVQDGCDNRCSFCVIPFVRGQSRSLQLSEVLREVNALVTAGYREVVISGVNLGRWGRDLAVGRQPAAFKTAELRFEDLIRAILDETSLEKLRISSVEPMDWTDELVSLVARSPRVAKHTHVPLQSGSDAVLRRMHRKYRPWHYRQKIEKIRGAMPTAAIGADVMVGFPGETAAEFEETRRMIERLPFTYLHVFTYSARPGTPAAGIADQIPVHIARERNRILRDLATEKKLAFMRSLVGETVEAITLGTRGTGAGHPDLSQAEFTEALTDNYQKLLLRGRYQPNEWLRADVECVETGTLVGTVDTTTFRGSASDGM
jgi:threonylcarbamoyladenosine tRNA methylthiotransferase MtaB